LTADEEVKTALKDKTKQAIPQDVFGAPSMFVDNELFFDLDRLDFVRETLG